MNKAEKEKRRFVAVASLGKTRWYWVVWPSLDEIRASDEPLLHVGEGTESSKFAAIERALELAGSVAEWMPAKYARIYHGNKPGAKRRRTHPRTPQGANIPKMDEFLYRDVYDPTSRRWVPVRHRVARRTKKFVFVEQHPYATEELTGSWLDRGFVTFRLDRRMLEREGYAFVPATADVGEAEEIYFSSEREPSPEMPPIKCLLLLNLSWPCTEAQVKKAYRILVRSAHPDGGGSQEAFLALQEAYEQALELCRKHAGKPTR